MRIERREKKYLKEFGGANTNATTKQKLWPHFWRRGGGKYTDCKIYRNHLYKLSDKIEMGLV